MKLLQAFKMAVSAIGSNKMRSFLTMLGIIIGVVSVTMLISVGQGTTSQVTSQIQGLGTNLLTVSINSPKPQYITLDDIEALQNDGGIGQVAPLLSKNLTVKSGTKTTSTSIEGTTSNYTEIRNLPIEQGRNLTQSDQDTRSAVAVIGTEVADELYGTRNVLGNTVTIEGRAFTIVGVLEEKGTASSGSNDNRIIIPFTTAQRLLGQTKITSFYAASQSEDTVDQAKATLTAFLNKHVDSEDYYNIFSQSDILSTMSTITNTLTLMLGGIAGISLLVGGIGIMNIMLVSVTERTREIGIRKAIGAQRLDIMSQFLIEAVVVCLFGGVIGLGIGYAGTALLGSLMNYQMSVSSSIALLALGFSMAIGVLFGVYPANKAAKLRPIQALRYE